MRCHAAPSDSSSRMRTCPRSSGICVPRPRCLATAASSSSACLPGRVTWTTIAVSGTRADRSRGSPTHPARATRFRRHRPGISPAAGLGRDGRAAVERTVRPLGVVVVHEARRTRSSWRGPTISSQSEHSVCLGGPGLAEASRPGMICPGERRACRDGTPHEASRQHVCRVEADSGKRPDLMSSQEREGIPRLRKENHELRCANEILKSGRVSLGSVAAGPGTCAKRRPPRRTSQGARVFGGGGQRGAGAA
jgi:hypothetical protein